MLVEWSPLFALDLLLSDVFTVDSFLFAIERHWGQFGQVVGRKISLARWIVHVPLRRHRWLLPILPIFYYLLFFFVDASIFSQDIQLGYICENDTLFAQNGIWNANVLLVEAPNLLIYVFQSCSELLNLLFAVSQVFFQRLYLVLDFLGDVELHVVVICLALALLLLLFLLLFLFFFLPLARFSLV